MKILVTGAAGYIGSTLIPMLLNEGHQVYALDNLLFNQSSLLTSCAHKNFEFFRGDTRDKNLLQELISQVDGIIPLACLVGAPLCDKDPFAAQTVNSDAIKMIYDLKSNDQFMIYPCTNSGYGVGEDGIYCDESSPLRPVSLYGKVKVEAESYLLDGGEALTFRFATLFGMAERMRLDLLVNDFVYRAVFDKAVVLFEADFKRNYLHVRDAARGFLHAIKNYSSMKGQAYNLGLSDTNISKRELCEKIQEQVPNFHFLISEIGKDPDQRNYIVSNKKIESTGYATQYSLEDGITELIKGFKIIKRNQFANI